MTIPQLTAEPTMPKYFGGTVSAMKMEHVTMQMAEPKPQMKRPMDKFSAEAHICHGTPNMMMHWAVYSAYTLPPCTKRSASKLPTVRPNTPIDGMRALYQPCHPSVFDAMALPAVP